MREMVRYSRGSIQDSKYCSGCYADQYKQCWHVKRPIDGKEKGMSGGLIEKLKDEFRMIRKAEKVELPKELTDADAEFFESHLQYELERAEAEQSRFANLPNLLAVTISIAVAANIAFLGQKDMQSWITVTAGLAILLHVTALFGILGVCPSNS